MAIDTNRANQLKTLAGMFPVANQDTAKQMDATRQINLQNTIQQASPGLASTRPAQQLGAQQAQQQGANQLQTAQENVSNATQLGQLGLQEQGRQFRGEAANRQMASERMFADFANQLNSLDSKLKNQLVDNQLNFQRDQGGRALLNEQQLQDFAVSKAKDDIELNKYKQMADQAWQRKLQTMQVASDKIRMALEQDVKSGESRLNNEQRLQMAEAKAALDRKIKADQAKAANKAAMWSTGGGLIGAGVGAAVGGPAGAGVGMSLGSGVGSLANSVF